MRSLAREVRDTSLFILRPPNWDEVISDKLPFGEPADDRFRDALSRCQQYLEYGSGASTLVAASMGCRFVTVESDESFLDAVRSRCAGSGADSADTDRRRYLYADIGRTGPWGVPLGRVRTTTRISRWSRYPLAPWNALGDDFRADLVLVDGRFRVACALAVILHQSGTEWTLLLDDYRERPEYLALEEVADLHEMWGRMAVFHPNADADPAQVQRMLTQYQADWR